MGSDDSTRELIDQARQGDRAAFDRLVGRFEARLRTAIHNLMGERLRADMEVDDVLQETLLRAFRSLPEFQWTREAAFFRWLRGIARNVALRAGARPRWLEYLELGPDPPASGTSPSRALRRQERLLRLEEALADLSPDHREVIRLARLEGLKMKEIAARMHRSQEAVMKLLSRALDKLRTSFGTTESLGLPERRPDEGGSLHEGP